MSALLTGGSVELLELVPAGVGELEVSVHLADSGPLDVSQDVGVVDRLGQIDGVVLADSTIATTFSQLRGFVEDGSVVLGSVVREVVIAHPDTWA